MLYPIKICLLLSRSFIDTSLHTLFVDMLKDGVASVRVHFPTHFFNDLHGLLAGGTVADNTRHGALFPSNGV